MDVFWILLLAPVEFQNRLEDNGMLDTTLTINVVLIASKRS